MTVHQICLIQALVEKYKSEHLQVSPMVPRIPLVAAGPDYGDVAGYSTMMGELQHLVNCTRPVMARAVSALSAYTCSPTCVHCDAAMQVVGCLHGTWNYGIVYATSHAGLQGWTDEDSMGDTRGTRTTTGIIFTMYDGAIIWQSRLQLTIARSTCEAEYMAASAGCHVALWFRKVLMDIGRTPSSPTVSHGDKKLPLSRLELPPSKLLPKSGACISFVNNHLLLPLAPLPTARVEVQVQS